VGRVNLTDKLVRASRADGKSRDLADSVVRGLTLRVLPSPPNTTPTRTYFVRYRQSEAGKARFRRLRIGDANSLPLTDARKLAKDKLADAAKGKDPQGAKVAARRRAAEGTTVRDLAARFVETEGTKWRPSTLTGWQRFLDREILPRLGDLAPEAVTKRHIRELYDAIRYGVRDGTDKDGNPVWKRKPAPVSANRCYEVVRRLFAWAVETDRLAVSPVMLKGREDEKGRERTYTNDELRAILATAGQTELCDLVPFIAYTGTRSHETRAARWADIDFERALWTIPPDDAKSDRKHEVPLSPEAVALLEAIQERQREKPSPWVFPAPTTKCGTCGEAGHMDQPNKALRVVGEAALGLKRSEVAGKWEGEALRLHDLRRTVSDRMRTDLHVPPYVVDLGVLGHAAPELVRTYMPTANVAEVRTALEVWSKYLDTILSGNAKALEWWRANAAGLWSREPTDRERAFRELEAVRAGKAPARGKVAAFPQGRRRA
jgi:integrase